jgi:hypothetical protein
VLLITSQYRLVSSDIAEYSRKPSLLHSTTYMPPGLWARGIR